MFGRTLRLYHTSCVLTAKALARLRGCAGSPGPSLVAYVISTIISWGGSYEPSHEITVLFVLLKPVLQMRMRSHPVGLEVWFLVRPLVYFHTSWVRTAKALARLRRCAGSPEPLLVAYVSTIISCSSWLILLSILIQGSKNLRTTFSHVKYINASVSHKFRHFEQFDDIKQTTPP